MALISTRVHGAGDYAAGAGLSLLRRRRRSAWLPYYLLGVAQIAAAAMTAREPDDRSAPGSGPGASAGKEGVGAPPGQPAETAEPAQGGQPAPPAEPARAPEPPPEDRFDPLVAREEAAAAAAARRIGGTRRDSVGDPALDPVYEAGGGEQDGWEEAEALLIENASHGDGDADPEHDAFTPEVESDRSTAAYGEPDEVHSTEVEAELYGDGEHDGDGDAGRPGPPGAPGA